MTEKPGVSPSVPIGMGRAMLAKLKGMRNNVSVTSLPESEVLVLQAGARPMEFKPLLENSLVTKKGTLGSRLVLLLIYFVPLILISLFFFV